MDNSNEINLERFLQIEADDEILSEVVEDLNIPAWLYIRTIFFRMAFSDFFFSEQISSPSGSFSKTRKIKTLLKAAGHNFSRNKNRSEIALMVSGWGSIKKDGKNFDRLGGYFADCFPNQSLIISELGNWNVTKKNSFTKTYYSSPKEIYFNLSSKLIMRKVHIYKAEKIVKNVIRRSKKYVNWIPNKDQELFLINFLARKIAIAPFITDSYSKFFMQNGFKILLKEDGCFGHSANIIVGAKQAGLITAEFQHGVISKGHDGYNFASNLIKNSNFNNAMPSVFLSYGKWWHGQTNIPSKKIIIGNPHRDSHLDMANSKNDDKTILVLGDGIDTKKTLDLCQKIVNTSSELGYKLVFRPHPFEKEGLKISDLPKRCELDENINIYNSFHSADFLISEVSTGIFEAVGLVKNIFVWKTNKSKFAFPEMPFLSFTSAKELLDMIADSSYSNNHNSIPADELWSDDWENNYRTFIENHLK